MTQTERETLLEEITAKVTRDNGRRFTDTSRLDYIKSILTESDYEVLVEMPLSVVYMKKNTKLQENIVLISSHVDCVKDIRNPRFKITKKGNYKGTFDNAATNAAIVIAMLENSLSEQTLVAFTGDEEEDSEGAKQTIEFLEKSGKKVLAISLDATFDLESEIDEEMTTYRDASYTIDNLINNTRESIARLLFATANELGIPYMVTRADDKDYFDDIEDEIPDYYNEELEVEDTAYEDEAVKYSENRSCIGSFSLCIPTDDTDDDFHMHTDKLIKIKKKSFHEFIAAVVQISNRLAEELPG